MVSDEKNSEISENKKIYGGLTLLWYSAVESGDSKLTTTTLKNVWHAKKRNNISSKI